MVIYDVRLKSNNSFVSVHPTGKTVLMSQPHTFTQPHTHTHPHQKQRALYNEESAKVKARHETELGDLTKRHAEKHADQLRAFEAQIHRLSSQIFKLNDQSLSLRQQNEHMRHKLMLSGNGGGGGASAMMRPSLGGLSNAGRETGRVMPASSMCKYRPAISS